MSTAQTPISAVVENFSDAFTEVLQEASNAARTSASVYREGLDIIVEQQRLAGESSRQWVSEVASLQRDFGREVVRGYASAARQSAAASIESAEQVESSAAKVAQSSPAKPAPTSRKRTATRRQTSKEAASPPAAEALAAAANALSSEWSSDGYDALSATDVVDKLPGYSQAELGEVELYERAHDSRQTVLTRIESLRGLEPVAGYDGLTVPEVQARLTDADEALASAVRDYEQRHKKREGVLSTARDLIDKGE